MLRPAATLDLICEHLGVETGLISQVPRENVSAFVARSATNRARRAALRVGQSAERVLPANAWRRV